MAQGQQIASMFATIGAETSGFEQGMGRVKSSLAMTAQEARKIEATFQQTLGSSFINTLSKGASSSRDLGLSFLETAKNAGVGGYQLEQMAQATGLFSGSQLKAASSSMGLTLEVDRLVNQLKNGEISAAEAGRQFGELSK